MTPKTASILADPHPKCHIVYPCTDDKLIAEAVTLFSSGGLSRDEAVVLLTTPAHRIAIEESLRGEGFDLDHLKREGRLVILDAKELLSQVLVEGMPEVSRFHNLV